MILVQNLGKPICAKIAALCICVLFLTPSATAQIDEESMCGTTLCAGLDDPSARRLSAAWHAESTTNAQRAQMRKIIADKTLQGVTNWQAVATEYFTWRNGIPYQTPADVKPNDSRFHPEWDTYRSIAEGQVKESLIDPDSAKFRWPYGFMHGIWRTPKKYEGLITCGEVNAHNRMGGYTGFQSFVVIFNGDRIIYLDIDDGAGPGLENDLCSRASRGFPPPGV